MMAAASWKGVYGRAIQEAAQRSGITVLGVLLRTNIQEAEFRRAFETVVQEGVDALVIAPSPESFTYRRLIVELGTQAHLPVMYPFREHIQAGGLIGYVIDLADLHRRLARTIDRVLRGERAGDIPFQLPTRFDLLINLMTARNGDHDPT